MEIIAAQITEKRQFCWSRTTDILAEPDFAALSQSNQSLHMKKYYTL